MGQVDGGNAEVGDVICFSGLGGLGDREPVDFELRVVHGVGQGSGEIPRGVIVVVMAVA